MGITSKGYADFADFFRILEHRLCHTGRYFVICISMGNSQDSRRFEDFDEINLKSELLEGISAFG